jgi:ATP phosphoribosyltransferase regulatory subunit HisZ
VKFGAREVVLPSLEPSTVYVDKAGPEVLGQMYVFPDKAGRPLCLRPELLGGQPSPGDAPR